MTFTLTSTRPRLYILAGIPGCGKSTWAHRFFPSRVVVSSDEIRGRFFPGPYDAGNNDKVFEIFHRELGELLSDPYTRRGVNSDFPRTAVADATNLNPSARDKLRTVAAYVDAETHLVFFNNPEQSFRRNLNRTGNALVPEDAMGAMYGRYRDSRTAILNEGYTSITFIEGVS